MQERNNSRRGHNINRRQVLGMSALTTAGATGLLGTTVAAKSNQTPNRNRFSTFSVESLYSSSGKKIVYYEDEEYDFILNISSEDLEVGQKGEIQVRAIRRSEHSSSERKKLKKKVEENGSVDVQFGAPDLRNIWNPGYQIWTDVRGDCPAIPFDKDYEWGFAVDTGLPHVPGVAGDKIEKLALDWLCQVVENVMDTLEYKSESASEEAVRSSSSPSAIEPQLSSPDPRVAIAALVAEKGCKYLLSPLVGGLTNGATTLSWFDCHDPSRYTEFTAVCHGTISDYVTEGGRVSEGPPVVPGAHYGLDEEYWNIS